MKFGFKKITLSSSEIAAAANKSLINGLLNRKKRLPKIKTKKLKFYFKW